MSSQFHPGKQLFSSKELAALKLLQTGIEACSRPFLQIAEQAGCDEQEIIALLQRLRSEGVVRRFGAAFNYTRAGFVYNALVAWDLRELGAELHARLGECAARFEFVSHCYLRYSYASPVSITGTTPLIGSDSTPPNRCYQLCTMLHARNRSELKQQIDTLHAAIQAECEIALHKPLVLRTLQEYKKSTMLYF